MQAASAQDEISPISVLVDDDGGKDSSNIGVTWFVQNVGTKLHVWTRGDVNLTYLNYNAAANEDYFTRRGIRASNDKTVRAVINEAVFYSTYVQDDLAQEMWDGGLAGDKDFGVSEYTKDKAGNSKAYVYFQRRGTVAHYAPTVDFYVSNKSVHSIWGENLDDMDRHVIADFGPKRRDVGIVQLKPIATPEPSSISLLGIGLFGFLMRRKR